MPTVLLAEGDDEREIMWAPVRAMLASPDRKRTTPPPGPRIPFGTRVSHGDVGYELSIPVGPALEPRLERRGEDLLVQAGSTRRRMRLTGALARCTIEGTRRDGERLVALMAPDPALWPDGARREGARSCAE